MERRRRQRTAIPSSQGVSFALQDAEIRYLGAVKDISDDGVGISSSTVFTPGTMLDLLLVLLEDEVREHHFIGEVRWCAPDSRLKGFHHLGIAATTQAMRAGEDAFGQETTPSAAIS